MNYAIHSIIMQSWIFKYGNVGDSIKRKNANTILCKITVINTKFFSIIEFKLNLTNPQNTNDRPQVTPNYLCSNKIINAKYVHVNSHSNIQQRPRINYHSTFRNFSRYTALKLNPPFDIQRETFQSTQNSTE